MNVRELKAALDGVPDDLEICVGYEGTWNNFDVTAGEEWVRDWRRQERATPIRRVRVFMVSTV